MEKTSKGGKCLKALVKLALPSFKQAESENPQFGRGRKLTIPEWFMAVLIMIAVLEKKKGKLAQFRYLSHRRHEIAAWTGAKCFPSLASYCRRYVKAHKFYRAAVRVQGEQAIAEGIANPEVIVVDKSLVDARGPEWHKTQQRAGKIPAGVDVDATWGFSEYHDWVFGYSYEVAVAATPGSVVFPLMASVDVASASEATTAMEKLQQLPAGVVYVAADAGYDSNRLGEAVEYDADGNKTGRHFLCPENPRNNARKKTKPCHADKSRAESRRRRAERHKYRMSAKGKRIYARRSKTVEPFNHWLKSLFELDGKVWHRGLDNNRTQMLAAVFAYQLLVRYNHKHGSENGQVRWILEAIQL